MPSLTSRSVIRLGANGLVITIPKGWAVFNQVQPGDKLTVITNDDVRILAPARTSKAPGHGKKEGADGGGKQ